MQWQGSATQCHSVPWPCRGGGQPGLALGRMEEAGAGTHVTVVLSNCSSRLSMADDCKYGSSLSVCLSVRSVSVLASPVLVLCGCPCPAHALLRLWSSSWSPPLPGTGSRPAHASPSGMWWVERPLAGWQCRDAGRDRGSAGVGGDGDGSATSAMSSALPDLGSVLRAAIPREARAAVRAARPSPRASVPPRGPGWGLAVVGVRAELFPARRRRRRRSLSGTGGPWPGARCWGRLLARVVRLLLVVT